MTTNRDRDAPGAGNFIREIIDADLRAQAHDRIVTRFPPEPNGYLHIGHAKSICLNFGIARDYGGVCNLRFDDTNPTTEDVSYVDSIKDDIRWLGFDWGDNLFFASDYFERIYEIAEKLIRNGRAYVCSLSEDEIRAQRGTLSAPGTESPYRSRSVEDNLDLLRRMRGGEFSDGAHVLRARIDMAAANMKMRDPLLYRIRHAHHHRTGDRWCIYPMYDFAHPLSDGIEGVTHSICTLEFENNRELYDWVVTAAGFDRPPKQIEFARLNLGYTVMSKRKLLQLVQDGTMDGWDDPRMPTIAGLRRRGVTPAAIRRFAEMIGVAKANSLVDVGKLEYAVRDDLNYRAPRAMCVTRPLKLVITSYPEDREEWIEAPSFPPDVGREGSREVPFSRELYIERDDFAEEPPKGFKRLAPGRTVRLRHAYAITCDEVIKDPQTGEVRELRCSHDPDTLGGGAPAGRKPSGVIHWVCAGRSVPVELRVYDRLFVAERPDAENLEDALNPDSLVVLADARAEPSVAGSEIGSHVQFERQGYFAVDPDSTGDRLVWNRVVSLRDSWTRARPGARPAATADAKAEPARAKPKDRTRPQRRSRAEVRERARAADPDLAARHRRYRDELGLGDEEADLLTGDRRVADLFEAAAGDGARTSTVAKLVINEVLPAIRDREAGGDPAELPFGPAAVGELAELVDEGTITPTLAKEVFALLGDGSGSPREIVKERGLEQVADAGALGALVSEVLEEHSDKVEAYRGGKAGLFGFFVGQVMKRSGGKANAQLAREILGDRLGDAGG